MFLFCDADARRHFGNIRRRGAGRATLVGYSEIGAIKNYETGQIATRGLFFPLAQYFSRFQIDQMHAGASDALERLIGVEAGPGLLAHILFSKYGLHLPLNRQSAVYAREGVDPYVSTLADWVGAAAATLMPLVLLIRAHVFAAERIHADDTTVRVLAKGKTRTGRLWTYVRDDRPFGGPDPPAVTFFDPPDRSAKHPEQHLASYAGLMQADAYAGFNRLYSASRKPSPITEVACRSHARHNFFDLVRLAKAPIAIEAVKRIDELFAIEREINGLPTQERLRVRNERSRPLMVALEAWLREPRTKLSGQSNVSKAIAYCLTRWVALTRFLDDGRLCMSNNAAEREIRPLPSVATTGPSQARMR